jgi:hypothetical protein
MGIGRVEPIPIIFNGREWEEQVEVPAAVYSAADSTVNNPEVHYHLHSPEDS